MRYIAVGCILAFAGLCFAASETTTSGVSRISIRDGKQIIDPLPTGYSSQEEYWAEVKHDAAVLEASKTPQQRERSISYYDSMHKWDVARELGLHEVGDGQRGLYGTTGPARIVRDDLISSGVTYSSRIRDVYPPNGDKFVHCRQNRESHIWFADSTKPYYRGGSVGFDMVFKPGVEITSSTIEAYMVRPDFSKRKVILSSPNR